MFQTTNHLWIFHDIPLGEQKNELHGLGAKVLDLQFLAGHRTSGAGVNLQ